MIPSSRSLVKYESPIQLSKISAPHSAKNRSEMPAKVRTVDSRPKTTGSKMSSTTPKDKQTEEILNNIFPPKQWTENGLALLQQVSTTPATELDVVTLQEELDKRLLQRKAREAGICPIRRELYTQCFDELIRQLTVSCSERGLLLFRVRDELRMTLAAYQTLYESSVAYGMRKALRAEKGQEDCERKVDELELHKAKLQRQVLELTDRCEQIEIDAAEQRRTEDEKHGREMHVLKRENKKGKDELSSVVTTAK